MNVVIVASYVSELVFRVPRLMGPGETLSGSFCEGLGGKGFNMSIAARRCGANVVPVLKLGNDAFAGKALQQLATEGISTRHVTRTEGVPSGIGMILIADDGQNSIAIDPGANAALGPHEILAAAGEFAPGGIVLAQLETPVAAACEAFTQARRAGAFTILNPAPAPPAALPAELLALTDLITPNESEAAALTQRNESDDWLEMARDLQTLGPASVAITLGARGVGLLHGGVATLIPAPTVKVADTSGAGDAFNGALAAALAAGLPLEEACRFAVRYASVQVTRPGTSAAMPFANEIPGDAELDL